ncbi:MAG: hypothetical protein FWG84_04065 [Bacteroidales bacterium]|nr:hypothetical protein [Bacteroidales bacterium]
MNKYKIIIEGGGTALFLWLGWVGNNYSGNSNCCSLICIIGIISAIFLLKGISLNYFHEVEKLASNGSPSKWCEGWKNLNTMPESYDLWKIKPCHQIFILLALLFVFIFMILLCPQK